MVNQVNLEKAIAVMRRAKEHDSVYMPSFQRRAKDGNDYATTEAELHACGNKACFAGHVAVSPEFQADGGVVYDSGGPGYKAYYGVLAIAEWLEISNGLSDNLVNGNTTYDNNFSNFYQKTWYEVNADDVLEKLYMIQRGELE